MHFEELWELAENFNKENNESSLDDIINELLLKIQLYKASIPSKSEDLKEAKSFIFGEILLLLTSLSYKDNINVYTALKSSLDEHNINYYSLKYE
jgi:hypothetical protein